MPRIEDFSQPEPGSRLILFAAWFKPNETLHAQYLPYHGRKSTGDANDEHPT